MRGRGGWLLWAGALLLLLLVGAVATANSQHAAQRGLPPLDPRSGEPDGALALYLWTGALGRDVERLEYRPFALGGDDALLVSLRPFDGYEPEQLTELRGWLRGGGSLLLATDTAVGGLLRELGVELEGGGEYASARAAQPLLRQPPVEAVAAPGSRTLEFEEGVPLLASQGDGPVLVRDEVGAGSVWVLSAPLALSNGRLPGADNWKLYLNVLARARAGDVVFDEYHRGKPEEEGLRALLLRERWGWAFWYTADVLLGYTVLRGKRLGRPVTAGKTRYRSSGEYVRSLAGMLRAGRKREYLRAHYEASLRRSLQRAALLPPGAGLEELRRAAEERTGAPAGKVVEAIEALRGGARLSEKEMLRLVREAERERRRLGRRRAW